MIEVRGVDERGKVRVSMKAVDQATGEDISNKPVEAAPAAGKWDISHDCEDGARKAAFFVCASR